MIALIVDKAGTPRGPLPYAFELAGMDTIEVLSVDQADCLVRLLGPESCVVVIEAGSLSGAPGCGAWEVFLRSRSELSVVVTACSKAHDSIRDLVSEEDWILLEDPFDAAAVVAAARRVYDSARGCDAEHMVSRICDRRMIGPLVPRRGKVRSAAVGCEGGGR